MRREVIIAIILGVGLGIAVAFGVWRANIALSSKMNKPTPAAQMAQNAGVQNPNSSDLLISSPEDNSISGTDSVMIKGSATPRATVAISSNTNNEIVQADSSGSFEKQITLDGGPNEVIVKSYDEQGNESTQRLTIVYSTEFSGQ